MANEVLPYPALSTYPSDETYPDFAAVGIEPSVTIAVPSARVLRETAPDVAGLYLTNANGSQVAARPDSTDLALVDYSFTSQREGGFATLDAQLVPPARDRHELKKFQPARLALDAGDTLWEGRVEAPGEVSDDGQIDLACIGLSVALSEIELTFLGVSNDLSLWSDPPRGRIDSESAANRSINHAFAISAGEDGLAISMDENRNVATSANGEAWWGKVGLIKVATMQYMADEQNGGGMAPQVRGYDSATGSAIDSAALTTTLAKTTFTPTSPTSYMVVHDSPTGGPANSPARTVTIYAASLFGDHDLGKARIDGLPDGLFFSDVLRFLTVPHMDVERDGVPTIYRSSDPSPNLAWLESATLREVLDQGLLLEPTFSWGVWEGPTLHYGPRHRGAVWEARRDLGAEFSPTGATASEEFNVAIVEYEDRDGRPRRAGPPGWDCHTEDDALRNSDPSLAANQFGVDKPLVIELGEASPDKAVAIGELGLREAAREHWQGDVRLPRYALRDGVWSPTSLLRGDDVIRDGETGRTLPVASASYQRSSARPAAATIDTPANRLDAALAEHEARPRRVNKKRIRRRARRQRHKRQQARRELRRDRRADRRDD